MSTDAADVAALLPDDRRVGEIEVVEIDVVERWDTDDWGDVLEVTLTLSDPAGLTWSRRDMHDLEQRIRRGLLHTGEERWVWFHPRSVGDVARARVEAAKPVDPRLLPPRRPR